MKKSAILYIDSSKKDTVLVGIINEGQKELILEKSNRLKAQIILTLIEKILKLKNIELNSIKEIKIETKLGSFVGLRVGLSIANTLGFLLQIPVNGKIAPVLPRYGLT